MWIFKDRCDGLWFVQHSSTPSQRGISLATHERSNNMDRKEMSIVGHALVAVTEGDYKFRTPAAIAKKVGGVTAGRVLDVCAGSGMFRIARRNADAAPLIGLYADNE